MWLLAARTASCLSDRTNGPTCWLVGRSVAGSSHEMSMRVSTFRAVAIAACDRLVLRTYFATRCWKNDTLTRRTEAGIRRRMSQTVPSQFI